jgi:acetylornithine deacetylase/succinyl-diaminopimelate desuccinylase-like protein
MSEKQQVYEYIDSNLEDHTAKIQEFVRQRSISQTGEGVEECAALLRKYLLDFGCQTVEIVNDGTYISPVVFGKYDVGAPKTLIVYMMYDVQPAEDVELWSVPPFEARIVERAPFKKVIMARGAYNSKGPLIAFLNSVESIKVVAAKLPVNLIFVAEGEEERLSVSLREKFVPSHVNELKKAQAVLFPSAEQDMNGLVDVQGGSEGLIYIELECSGKRWGRGPTEFGIHGAMKRLVDSPAWRMIKALGTLVDDNGNRVNVDGWYENVKKPSKEDLKIIKEAAKYYDPELEKKTLKIKRFMNDEKDPNKLMTMMLFNTTLNLDGIWGGYIGPGCKAFLPHKVTSKHNIRFVPNQEMRELVGKIRKHLDKRGYKDIEMRVLGGFSWSKANFKSALTRAVTKTYDEFHAKYIFYPPVASTGKFSPAWPACAFSRAPLKLPIIVAGLGHGARAHSPDEFYVIEGTTGRHGEVYGLAGAEKSYVSTIYNYAASTGRLRFPP